MNELLKPNIHTVSKFFNSLSLKFVLRHCNKSILID